MSAFLSSLVRDLTNERTAKPITTSMAMSISFTKALNSSVVTVAVWFMCSIVWTPRSSETFMPNTSTDRRLFQTASMAPRMYPHTGV